MYWRPAPKEEPPVQDLPYELKRAVAQRFWGHDGTLHGDDYALSKEDIPYLEGLADAGIDGATELIEAIRQHGRVLVWIGG
jgi:hypothetical protein